MGKIVLFYKYITLTNPDEIAAWQRELCTQLGLKGRIIIAHEGINGTVGGPSHAIEQYKQAHYNYPLFSDIDFKESAGTADYFPRLSIKIKQEIVRLGIDPDSISARDAGEYLTPEQAHELIKHKPDNLVLLDTRNNYESRVGTYEDAVLPNTQSFRDFPAYIDSNLEKFQDKQVLMFCTGGVRCERASAYLKSKKVTQQVYHIKGGIHKYIEAYPNGFFKGKNYVFDDRVTTQVTNDILTHCEHCQKSYDEYTNCINAECNKQIIVCPDCITSYHRTCSTTCLELVQAGTVKIRTTYRKVSLADLDTHLDTHLDACADTSKKSPDTYNACDT